jgi:transcriptional regulator GlxA family with amidase domain
MTGSGPIRFASPGGETRVVPVFVVLPPHTLLLDVAGPVEVLRKANQLQDRVRFDVTYVGPSSGVTSSIGLRIAGIGDLPEILPDHCIVVVSGNAEVILPASPAGQPDPDREAHESAIVEWLRTAIRPGITLVSICSGALLAARAGLLDGRECTTHFGSCADLARLAPKARVVENRLFVEDGERLTSAGITAGIDLMLHLVGGLTEPGIAVAIARYLVVYLRRGPGDPQMSPWMEGRNHIHPVIHRVQDAIATDPARSWSLDTLARLSGASPRHLSRLFNEQTGMSVPDYVNRLRVALAREILGQTRLDMERVAERAGFASSRQLRRAWSRFHAAPPRTARASI